MARYRCLPPCTHSTTSSKLHHKHIQACRYSTPITQECAREDACPRAHCRPSSRASHLCKRCRPAPPAPKSLAPWETPIPPAIPGHTYTYTRPIPEATCCTACGSHFSSPELLDRHYNRQHYCNRDSCDSKFFVSPGSLQRHLLKTHALWGPATQSCRFRQCGYVFKAPQLAACTLGGTYAKDPVIPQLKEHMEKAHAFCTLCKRYFFNGAVLSLHLDSPVHRDQGCRCLDCAKDFPTVHELVSHTCQIPCGDSYGDFTCDAVFSSKEDLERHQKRRSHGPFRKNGESASVKCIACNRKFMTPAAMVAHLESGRCKSGVNRTVMDMALVAFDTQGTLHDREGVGKIIAAEEAGLKEKKMIEDMKEDEEGRWKCEECGKKFKSIIGLQRHIESPVHRARVYRCPPRSATTEQEALGVQEQWDKIPVANEGGVEETEEVIISRAKHRRIKKFKTVGGLAQHIETTDCGEKKMLQTAVEMVAQRMEMLRIEMEKQEAEEQYAMTVISSSRF